MDFKDFFHECNEKKVFKDLSIYVVSSWVLIQVFAILWEPFGLPKISMTYLLLILLIGFPVYVYLLWKYRLKTLENDKVVSNPSIASKKRATSKQGIDLEEKSTGLLAKIQFRNSFNKMYFTFLMIITAVTVFSASLIIKAKFGDSQSTGLLSSVLEVEKGNKIAVLPFENNTMQSDLDVVGKMAVDWIMHGITQNKVGQVISPKIVEEYTGAIEASMVPSGDNSILKDYLKPSKVINGTYYLSGGKLLLQCSILDENLTTTLISFEPVDCDPESPLDCIEELKQEILGYLITEGDKSYIYDEMPPKYEAYQLLLEARTKYTPSDPEYLTLLNDAIASDPDFYEAKIDRLEYYYNRNEFARVDSLFTILSKETSNNKRQVNLLNWYEALLKGNNRNAYNYFKNEYELEPFDLQNNSTAMVLALQFVNRPEDVDTIYNTLSMKDMDLTKCRFCEFRNYIKALADLELGHPEKVVAMFASYEQQPGFEYIKDALINAYVDLNRVDKVSDVLANIKLTQPRERWHSLLLYTAKDFMIEGEAATAKNFLKQLIDSLLENHGTLTSGEKKLLAFAFYFDGQYEEAKKRMKTLIVDDRDIEMYTYLAISALKTGDETDAQAYLQELEQMRGPYQYGSIDYSFAQFYASKNEPQKAIDHLMEAVADGKRYIPKTFQHDIHFKPLLNTESFQKVMDFWK